MIARVAPAILELPTDGMPRNRRAIVAALTGRHDNQDVTRTFMRVAVPGQVAEAGDKYALATGERART